MKIKFSLKSIWLAIGLLSLILLAFHWFGFDSQNYKNSILVLNAVAFMLSLPCSIFVVPVIIASSYYLTLDPTSADGIYLNTILLFVIGLVQRFWIDRFWSPTEPQFQGLGLPRL